MRTSLTETARIDHLIEQMAKPGERLLLQPILQLDPEFAAKVAWQQKAHALARLHGREELLSTVRKVDSEMFQAAQHHLFRRLIYSIFKK